jgi:hypothetical protein
MSLADVKNFRVGHQVLLRISTDYSGDRNARVTAVTQNGASSFITVNVMETDTSNKIATCDTVLIIGSINAEGANMPDAISYDPNEHYNYTQIFRTALEITRTARRTKLRTKDAYLEAKREALELHSIEMEKAFFWGKRWAGTGDNGKPIRASGGLIEWISSSTLGGGSVLGVVSDYYTDTDYSGRTWEDGGEDWLDTHLEEVFRYGSEERMAFCGSTAILAINKLVKLYGNYQIAKKEAAYGIKVMEWITPFGTLYFKRHPLFSYETTNSRSMVIFDPKDLEYKYIDDTTFYDDPEKKNSGWTRKDATKEEYLTECGLEMHFPQK